MAWALATGGSTLPGDFVLDDAVLVERRDDLKGLDLRRILLLDYWSDERIDRGYRPLALLTFALNFHLGDGPLPFHLVNVLLHAAVAFVAYRLLLEILGNAALASLGAALYAALPVHVEAVASILGRAEILSGLSILTVWLLALYNSPAPGPDESLPRPEHKLKPPVDKPSRQDVLPARRERAGLVVAAGAVTLLGLFSREDSAQSLPLLILAGSWILRRPVPWRTLASVALAILSYYLVRETALEGSILRPSFAESPLLWVDGLTRALNAVALLGRYLLAIVFSLRPARADSLGVEVYSPGDPVLWLWIAGATAFLAGAFLLCRRRLAVVALAAITFAVAVSPAANFFFATRTLFAESLAYVPALAWPLALCGLALALSRRKTMSGSPSAAAPRGAPAAVPAAVPTAAPTAVLLGPAIVAALIVLIVAYGTQASVRGREWSSREAFERRLSLEPAMAAGFRIRAAETALGRWQRASAPEEKKGYLERAASEAEEALRLAPGDFWVELLAGEVALQESRFPAAVEHLSKALSDPTARILSRLRPSEPEILLLRLRGEAYLCLDKAPDAFYDLDRVIRAYDDSGRTTDATIVNRRGMALAQAGNLQAALKDFNTAVLRRTDLPEVWNNRGFCRFKLGDLQGALEDYTKGLDLCREMGLLNAPAGDSARSFHVKITDVYRRLAKDQAAKGDSAGAQASAAQADRHATEAAKIQQGGAK